MSGDTEFMEGVPWARDSLLAVEELGHKDA